MNPRLVFSYVFFSIVFAAKAQDVPKAQVKLLFPDKVAGSAKPKGDLHIYLYFSASESEGILHSKAIGKKTGEGTYEFDLPERFYMLIGFQMGKYSFGQYCLDNTGGGAREFEINLEKSDADFSKVKFLPPCVKRDED